MSWVRMDDRWPSNRKLRAVEPLDRLFWVMAIAYTSDQRTDGRLDGSMAEYVAFLAGVTKPYEALDRLVAARLVDLDAGGWVIHDYLEFNPTTKQIEARNEARAEAGRRGGQKSGEARRAKAAGHSPTRSKREANASGVASLASNPVPSRPVLNDPQPPTSKRDLRVRKVVAAAAWEIAKTTPGVRNVGALQAKICRDADDEGLTDQIERLLARHPDRDDQWIVDEHLRRPHPLPTICHHCNQPRHTSGPCPALLAEADR